MVDLPVVHLELEPDEVGQYGRGARLRFDWGGPLAGFGLDDGEAVGGEGGRVSGWMMEGWFCRWEPGRGGEGGMGIAGEALAVCLLET